MVTISIKTRMLLINVNIPSFLIILIVVNFLNCAHFSNKAKTISLSSGCGVIGATFGILSTPQEEKKWSHAWLWGTTSAFLGSIIGLFIFDEEKKTYELIRQNQTLQMKIEALKNQENILGKQTINSGIDFKKLPQEIKKLIAPGSLSIIEIDQWISTDKNTLIHQDKILKLTVPQFFQSPIIIRK